MGDPFRNSALPDFPTEGELWDVDRLERHAHKLADQSGDFVDATRLDLRARLRSNAEALGSAYTAVVAALRDGRAITPAAQWLVDNFHVVSDQLNEVPLRLTPRVWRALPAANHREASGWPRIFHIAVEYLRHTLWEFSPQSLQRFLAGYQAITPLEMREIWALYPIMRIALIDELRRIAVRVEDSLGARAAADGLADALLDDKWSAQGHSILSQPPWLAGRSHASWLVHLAHRLHAMGERGRPFLDELSQELSRRGTTIDDYIQRQHARRSASNLVARNIITSLRALASFDWRSLFESTSHVEQLLRTQSTYVSCDRRTRDRYRSCVEELARTTHHHEVTVTGQILALVGAAPAESADADLGNWLIGSRRLDLESELRFPVSPSHRLKRLVIQHAQPLYLGGVGALTLALGALALRFATDWQAPAHPFVVGLMLLALFPMSELVIGFLNRQWMRVFPPQHLPRLALEAGLQPGMEALVVVPILLRSPLDAVSAARQLHVHALANPDPRISFALLSDWADSPTEHAADDSFVLDAARHEIAALNAADAIAGRDIPRFFLLHRRRLWSDGEHCFMGWERKRGKLEELNRLLLGKGPTTFLPDAAGTLQFPRDIRFVLTVDADTRLPMGCVRDLVGIAAHPLNRPVLSKDEQRVVEGYGVLQPRITPLLPGIDERSLYREIVTSGSGVDPYAAAASDLNQDVFGEGLFTGKGLYDLRAWDFALQGRVPENALLSHDLFEGLFARCGLVSDIELFEEFPSHSEVAAARSHRWMRGDWQLLPWIAGMRGRLPPLGRWKMLDNLRRSLLAPCSVALLIGAFADQGARPLVWLLVVLAPWLWPSLSAAAIRLVRWPSSNSARTHLRRIVVDLGEELIRATVSLGLLAQNAWLALDAIGRALFRLLLSRRHLLEWMTAAQLKAGRSDALTSFVWPLKGASIVVVAAVAILMAAHPPGFNAMVPLLLFWWLSPLMAQLLSQPLDAQREEEIPENTQRELRGVARLTWSFFERFVTAEDNFLPPDNFQEDPAPVLAHRSSPTNFGLYLLSTLAARDFGWLGLAAMTGRMTATMESLHRLERFDGHFLNWYDTRTLSPLLPRYVSTVDSGNLAGHLLALRQACIEFRHAPALSTRALCGPLDALALCRDALHATLASDNGTSSHRQGIHAALSALLRQPGTASQQSLVQVRAALEDATRQVDNLLRTSSDTMSLEAARWLRVAGQDMESHLQDMQGLLPDLRSTQMDAASLSRCVELESALPASATLADIAAYLAHLPAELAAQSIAHAAALTTALDAIARQCHALASGMSFGFLYDRSRGLFSIGYRVADGLLDQGYYDLLASESRLASLVAIAKGDVPRSHWFRLGRRLTGGAQHPVLASWSGSMFEYLMPALVMHEPRYSLLDQTSRRAVHRQIQYGERHGLPWGISESAYNIRDREYTYQYSGFGLPSLGLKRGLASDYVVAPYASALAAMHQPVDASENFRVIASFAGKGYYGYYEALDFTASRLPEGKSVAVVRAYMAHHQGMSLVALDNVLHDRIMQARFHAEPGITASDLVLQERCIRFVEAPPLDETDIPVSQGMDEAPEVARIVEGHDTPTPLMHLLSNRNYTVMLTDAGAGFSTCRGRAVTRWREDPTQDGWGAFIYLQDLQSEKLWSAGFQPTAAIPDEYRVHFNEEGVTIARRDGTLRTTLCVVVAPEDDGELRRVVLRNEGLRARAIAVTSFAEIALATQRADIAHPGFSNLFIQTEFLPESGALLATRRPRSSREPQVWALHVIVGTGKAPAHLQYETDRSRFIGRGRDARLPQSMHHGEKLSGTVGNVLDPAFSLRTQVLVPPRSSVTVTYATFVTDSRDQALALVAKYRTPGLFDHVSESAWTFVRAELHYLQSSLGEAMLFQTLASHLLVSTQQLRARRDAAGPYAVDVTHLWRLSISGDRPILLIRCHSQDDLSFIHQCLRAQEYLRIKGLEIDVVILNEQRHTYMQDLQQAIERLARAFERGVYPLMIDAISDAERRLLLSLARVVLNPAQGSLLELLYRPPITRTADPRALEHLAEPPDTPADVAPGARSELEFFNGWGGFAADGREYAISLTQSPHTPAPWSNVLANEHFGSLVTERGAMCTWSMNSRENQLTAWSNDAVSDPSAEAFYLLEDDELWSPAAQPVQRSGARYDIRHGQGYSHFDVQFRGIASRLTVLVAPEDPVKLCHLRLTNQLSRSRRITIVSWVEWALGATRSSASQSVLTRIDTVTGAQFAGNPALVDFGSRIAFCDFGGRQKYSTDSRHDFLGRNGSAVSPGGVRTPEEWSPQNGAGRDPCCAFAVVLEIPPGATEELQFVLGQAGSEDSARMLVMKYRALHADEVLARVQAYWNEVLGAVQIRTPDRALDLLFNRWLLYQTIACRMWGRAAFYQCGGAYGFRDQLQDGMALTLCAPQQVRAHLLRAAARQFVEGDVQHWWHPPSGRGVRTHFSDDRVWLPYAVHQYIESTADISVLDEVIPFVEGPSLPQEQEDAHYVPTISHTAASLYEHCARALDISLATGVHDLPLMGGGDWNDGMNRVGHEGRGESVWLAWFLITTLRQFIPVAEKRRDRKRAARWRAHIDRLSVACEAEGWDGEWYRRAFFDDGTPLGTAQATECRIDSLSQSWAVIAGVADPARARAAMRAVDQHLVNRKDQIVLLFAPPFDTAPADPGYIKGYLPGLRENGGQYTHAAIWVLMAQAMLRNHESVGELLRMLNPVRHSTTADEARVYRVEPYVVAADIYAGNKLAGRGGWTWYTGAAGWFYRAVLEQVLGIRITGDSLCIDPCIPTDWADFEVFLKLPSLDYVVQVSRGPAANVSLDGDPVAGNAIPLLRDERRHIVRVILPCAKS